MKRFWLLLLAALLTAGCAKYTEREHEYYIMWATRLSNGYENSLRNPGSWETRHNGENPLILFRRKYIETPLEDDFQLVSAVDDCEERGAIYCSMYSDFVSAETLERNPKHSSTELDNAKIEFQECLEKLNEKIERTRTALVSGTTSTDDA